MRSEAFCISALYKCPFIIIIIYKIILVDSTHWWNHLKYVESIQIGSIHWQSSFGVDIIRKSSYVYVTPW